MPALRGLRGSVVGLCAAGLGLAGHAMAGGALPSAPVVGVATAGLVLLGVAMSDRPWGLPSLLTVLVGAQLALHVVLADGAHAQMHHMPGMSPGGAAMGPTMAAAHLSAAVITAVLLRRGELWCQALVELLGRPVRTVVVNPLPVRQLRRLPVHATPAGAHTLHLAHVLSRRGPPSLSLT